MFDQLEMRRDASDWGSYVLAVSLDRWEGDMKHIEAVEVEGKCHEVPFSTGGGSSRWRKEMLAPLDMYAAVGT